MCDRSARICGACFDGLQGFASFYKIDVAGIKKDVPLIPVAFIENSVTFVEFNYFEFFCDLLQVFRC